MTVIMGSEALGMCQMDTKNKGVENRLLAGAAGAEALY
jgi:hypothetical protein